MHEIAKALQMLQEAVHMRVAKAPKIELKLDQESFMVLNNPENYDFPVTKGRSEMPRDGLTQELWMEINGVRIWCDPPLRIF